MLRRRHILSAVLVAAIVGVWQVVASLPGVDHLTLASPAETWRALTNDAGLLFSNAATTLLEVALGLAIAVVLGAAIPVVVVAPLFVLAFDYGIGPKLAIVALICFFPVTVNLIDGLRSVEPELLKLMRSLGASRVATLWKVELPAALPYLFSGLRIAATVSVIGAVFGEWAGADRGLGRLVLLGINQLQTPRVYAGVVILMGMALLLFIAVSLAQRLAAPWSLEEAQA